MKLHEKLRNYAFRLSDKLLASKSCIKKWADSFHRQRVEPGSHVVLIGDERVRTIPVLECGEPIVDLIEAFPALTFDLHRDHVQKQSKSISLARRKIGHMLVDAQEMLPKGYRLLIKECHRPMWIQKNFWNSYSQDLRSKFPSWSESQIYDECSKLNAPLDVAPHTTGGAVDLTLMMDDGTLIDMGTIFNASPLDTEMATYTEATNVSSEAQLNRRILSQALSRAGFVNYPTEWWHWSYGDKYWAFFKNAPAAIYASTDTD